MIQTVKNCTRCKVSYFVFQLKRRFSENSSKITTKINNRPIVSDVDLNTNKELPEPPTQCCMSGCPNCVWIEYAQKLTDLFKDGGETAKKTIFESVTDPNMKAFLSMELRNMQHK